MIVGYLTVETRTWPFGFSLGLGQPRLPRDGDRDAARGERGAGIARGHVDLLDVLERHPVLAEHVGEHPLARRAGAHTHGLAAELGDRVDVVAGDDAVPALGLVQAEDLDGRDPVRGGARERVRRRRDGVEAAGLQRVEALHRVLDDRVADLHPGLVEQVLLDADDEADVTVPGREPDPDGRGLGGRAAAAAGVPARPTAAAAAGDHDRCNECRHHGSAPTSPQHRRSSSGAVRQHTGRYAMLNARWRLPWEHDRGGLRPGAGGHRARSPAAQPAPGRGRARRRARRQPDARARDTPAPRARGSACVATAAAGSCTSTRPRRSARSRRGARGARKRYATFLAAGRATPLQLRSSQRFTRRGRRRWTSAPTPRSSATSASTTASSPPPGTRAWTTQLSRASRQYFFNHRIARSYTREENRRSIEGHRRILAALGRGDGPAAEAYAREHVDYALSIVLTKIA